MTYDPNLNFNKALRRLKEFIALPINSDRDKAGIIQAFEFTYEQSWKSLQKRASNEGIQVKTPRQAFEFGIQIGFITATEENQWINLINDRNLTSHIYDETTADKVVDRITRVYLKMFESLAKSLL
jgi:nucleotidyltransferase substrate binding protein (TIGR01987 family)